VKLFGIKFRTQLGAEFLPGVVQTSVCLHTLLYRHEIHTRHFTFSELILLLILPVSSLFMLKLKLTELIERSPTTRARRG